MKFKSRLICSTIRLMALSIIVISSEQKTAEVNTSISEEWLSRALKQIRIAEYNPSLQILDHRGEPFSVSRCHFANRARNLRAYFDTLGMELMSRTMDKRRSWNVKHRLNSIYRTQEDIKICGGLEPEISENKILYRYRGVIDEYANSEDGIEQSIVIQEKPEGEGELSVVTDIETQKMSFAGASEDRVVFSANGNEIIYQIVKVEDADRKVLSSFMVYDGDAQLTICVDDEHATYPICMNLRIASDHDETEDVVSPDDHIILGLGQTPDWTVEGDQDSAYFGGSVSTAGDVDGDGYSDVIVGACYYDNGQVNEGRTFVYHGTDTGLSVTPDWMAEGDQDSALFGGSVSTAGDVNGDDYSDVIVGAPWYPSPSRLDGRAFVYHGSDTGLSTTPDWTADSDEMWAHFGYSVSTAGDVNGDGYSDVIVGAPLQSIGHVYVYHGSEFGLSTTPDWTAESDQGLELFGFCVSQAGDVDGDDYSDVIVGAHLYDNGQVDEGRAFVYHGSEFGLSGTADWTAEGDQDSAYFGGSVSTAGDVDGDGYSDVVVGACYYDDGQVNEGRAFVYHGSYFGLSVTPDWTAEGDQDSAYFGGSVSTAGDVDGDGYSDVIVGANLYDNGQVNEGRTFVYHGSEFGLSVTPDWTAEGDQDSAYFGGSVSTAGDVNGDGYSDVIIGACYYDYDNGQVDEGRVFVYHGMSDLPNLVGDCESELFSGLGDWTNDDGLTLMYDDGSHGDDTAEDNIYTIKVEGAVADFPLTHNRGHQVVGTSGTWDPQFPGNWTSNVPVEFSSNDTITFYFDRNVHSDGFVPESCIVHNSWMSNYSWPGPYYVVGNCQTEFGAPSDWNPADTTMKMNDAGVNGDVQPGDLTYTFRGVCSAADDYEFKVLNTYNSWSPQYVREGFVWDNGSNLSFSTQSDGEIVIFETDVATGRTRVAVESPVEEFIRGDVDRNGLLSLSDGLYCFRCQFVPGWPDSCRCDDATDADDNGAISIGDCLRILRKQFVPGWQDSIPPPCCTAPGDCGVDPTDDGLGCEEHSCMGGVAAEQKRMRSAK